MKTTNCPKCDGQKYLSGISYANGVCFMCSGTGQVSYEETKVNEEMGEDTRKRCEWILSAPADAVTGWTYARLHKMREFAYGYQMSRAAKLAYGDSVFDAYREKFEAEFFVAQERKLAAFYGN